MADEQFATGGYVSGPKPGDPPLVPDGCTLSRPERTFEPPPGVTVEINLSPPSARDFLKRLRRRLR